MKVPTSADVSSGGSELALLYRTAPVGLCLMDTDLRFESQDVPAELSHDVALCLYRITQESLRNIAKHAQSPDAYVSLVGVDDGLFLTIRDSGVGFDWSEAQGRMGLGLASMEERVRLIHGSISITSNPGHGTTVEVHAPCLESGT